MPYGVTKPYVIEVSYPYRSEEVTLFVLNAMET